MKSIQTLVFLIITTLFTLVSVAQNRPNSYTPKAKTVYQISIPKPQTHYIEVEMSLSDIDDNFSKSEGYIDFKMPVWTPGSYLIREYAKNVEHFMAFSGSNNVKAEKINKNTWRVKYEGQKDLTVKYGVYAYELSVRTSFVDNAHAYLNGASVFLFNPQFKKYPSKLKINLPSIFSQITTGLSKTVQTNVYDVVDFDNLVDCPIEIGNQKIFNFEANKIPHQVAMYGEVKFDSVKLKTDMKKVCETASKVIGEHPCQDYFFIVHNVTQGGGGLEHKNSTTLGVSRNAYATEASYNSFLSLVAHEYFHLWNVKRIRPIALGPFDYENENYTHNLWVSEGFTSYYQNHILQRARIISEQQYLTALEKEWSNLENTPGQKTQSASESSWDAWIKHYRPNENSRNATISYYDKGSVLGALMDMYIIDKTDGAKCLDDVLRDLYDEFYKKQGRGFSDAELQKSFEKISGSDMSAFFEQYIYGTNPLPYAERLNAIGIKLNEISSSETFMGADTRIVDGKVIVSNVIRDSPAYETGINVNDEILIIDGLRVSNQIDGLLKTIQSKKVGEEISIYLIRDGLLKEIKVKLAVNPNKNFKFEKIKNPSPSQETKFKKWLRVSID